MSEYISPIDSRSLGHTEKRIVKKMASLIQQGKIDFLKDDLLSSAKYRGLPDSLYLLSQACEEAHSWATTQRLILSLFEADFISGIDSKAETIVEQVRSHEPQNWDEAISTRTDVLAELLEAQVERGDFYLLNPLKLNDPELARFVPRISDCRRRVDYDVHHIKEHNGEWDITRLFQVPMAFDLLVDLQIPPYAEKGKMQAAIDVLHESSIIDQHQLQIIQESGVEQNKPRSYSHLFADCLLHRRDLFNGILQALDPNSVTANSGFAVLTEAGHHSTLDILIKALKLRRAPRIPDLIDAIAKIDYEGTSIPPIAVFLNSHTDSIAQAALRALGRLGATGYIGRISDFARYHNEDTFKAALQALVDMGTEQSIEKAADIVKSIDSILAVAGLHILARSRSARAFPPIYDLLLADSLSFKGRGDMPSMILGTLSDMVKGEEAKYFTEKIRDIVGNAIGELGHIAVPLITRALDHFLSEVSLERYISPTENNGVLNWVDSRTRDHLRICETSGQKPPVNELIKQLGQTLSEKAVPVLEEIVNSCKDEGMKQVTIDALSEIDLPAADVLLTLSYQDDKLQPIVAMHLGTIIDEGTTERTIELIDSDDGFVATAAMGSIILRNDPKLSPVLMHVARGNHELLKVRLARGLAKLTDCDAYGEIIDELRSSANPKVRNALAMVDAEKKTKESTAFWA